LKDNLKENIIKQFDRLWNRLRLYFTAKNKQIAHFMVAFTFFSILSIIVFRNFIFSSEWPGGGDVLGWVSRAYIYGIDGRWLYMWRPCSFGFVEIINILDFFLFLFHLIFISPQATVKAFMFFSFLLSCFSSYIFAYIYSRRHLAAFVGSLVYSMNHWMISQLFEAHIGILFSYAFAPIAFIILDNALKKARLKNALILGVVFSLILTSFHAECIVIYGFLFGLYLIFYLIFPEKSNSFAVRTKKLAKTLALAVPIAFLLSSFSLIPFLMNVRPYYFSPNYRYLLDEAEYFGYKNFFDALTLRATEAWGYVNCVDYSSGLTFPGFPITVMTAIIILSYSVLLFRRDRYTVFFAVCTLISSIISMGPNSAFRESFIWAWYNLPHFAVFRAVSRWIVLAALSHTFFVSLFAATLIYAIKKFAKKPASKVFFKMETKKSLSAKSKIYYVSVDKINGMYKKLCKSLYYLCIFVLALLAISPILYGYFLIGRGLQVYTPSENYLYPYYWLAEQEGDYRIVTVGHHPTDFADGSMSTNLGWGHEIGYESGFIHDKPVLQNGGWEYFSHSLVDFLRFQVVPNKMTRNLMDILGAFNYRYVVIPIYANSELREFFVKQSAAKVVYNYSGSLILENENCNQRIFGVTQSAIVIGGLDALPALYKIDSFNLSRIALFFADQLNNPFYTDPLFNKSQYLVFYNMELIDVVMLTFRNESFLIKLAQYGADSLDSSRNWIRSPVWRHRGKYVFGGDVIQTSGRNLVEVPFHVDSSELYSLWLRVGVASSRGTLTVMLDGINVAALKPETNYAPKLSWIFLGNFTLDKGRHLLTLFNDGTGFNEVDAFAFIKPKDYKIREKEIFEAIEGFKGRIIYLSDASEAFKPETGTCLYKQIPYQGYSLHIDGKGENIALTANVSASSVFNNDTERFDPHFTVDSSFLTRWASEPSDGIPQWLELSWSSKREIAGLQIYFENAKAQDYIIQSWNGTQWIDQISVTGNNQTTVYHVFSHPLETEKLRIYITAAPDYGMVSIWEIQVYSGKSTISTELFVPRAGYYSLTLHLSFLSDQNPLNILLGDICWQIPPSDGVGIFKWYETGRIFLQPGKYLLKVETNDEVELDQLSLYSVNENENISLAEIFSGSLPQPIIEFRRINPCKYEVYIKTNNNFFLIFSDSYHPLWKLYLENKEISSTPTDYCVNGFFIDRIGEYSVTLYFTGQKYTDLGYALSLITIVGLLVILIFNRKIEKLIKKLRERKKIEVRH